MEERAGPARVVIVGGGFAGLFAARALRRAWAWLFIHIGFLTGYRNRAGAVLGWWFAFTRDLRRERTFTIDDVPAAAGPYARPVAAGARPAAGDGPRQAG